MQRALLRFAAVAGAVSLGASGSLAAADPHAGVIEFVNETPQAVMFIYAHMDNVTDLEDDLLGEAVLEPGQRFKVNMDLGPHRCIYDIEVHLANEQRLTYRRFDACKGTALHVRLQG